MDRTNHAYRGIPIEENGEVIAVQRTKSIEAPDGKHYRGALGVDARGNEYVYSQYPDSGVSTEPPTIAFFLDTPPRQPNTRYRVLADGVIEADKIIMA